MKENFIHVCMIIDESGSMYGSVADVIGGFQKVIDEQRAVKDGTCSVSLYKFADEVTEIYRGKDVNEVEYLTKETYSPDGMTAMNDGIGTAIDKIGEWLAATPEEERPEKNLVVIMTDGGENSSKNYTLSKVRKMIKHQEEKYNWTFMYMGTDITDEKAAKDLGITLSSYSSRDNYENNYFMINSLVTGYRGAQGDAGTKSMTLNALAKEACDLTTSAYETAIGFKIKK